MNQMLENKVSNLLADVKKLEENITELNETIEGNRQEKVLLQSEI
jgi:hypothetical protein